MDRENKKKGLLTDNDTFIFDSYGQPIQMRFGYRNSDASRLCEGKIKHNPMRRCKFEVSQAIKARPSLKK